MATKAWCNRAGDNVRIAKSLVVSSPAAAVYDCVQIPRWAFIWNAWLQVLTVGSSNDVQMGFRGDGSAIDDVNTGTLVGHSIGAVSGAATTDLPIRLHN